jgi:transcriptional regulator with XRE-family HTH domain
MAMRKSDPLDQMVGARIRVLRIGRGMKQAVLAERIGINSQQLQKYERGISRVGAGRLSRIASALDVSIGELFESSEAGSSGLSSPMRLLTEPGALRLLKAYARTTDPRVRLCLAKLVESMADRTPGVKARVARLDPAELSERRRSPFQG